MAAQYPLTNEQLFQINKDLAEIKLTVDEMAHLMAAGLGEKDQRTIRAEELAAAVERLQWAIERGSDGGVTSAGS